MRRRSSKRVPGIPHACDFYGRKLTLRSVVQRLQQEELLLRPLRRRPRVPLVDIPPDGVRP